MTMTPLHISYSSQRAPTFRTETMVYLNDGEKVVRKRALIPEAIPFVMKNRENYRLMSEKTICDDVRCVDIIKTGDDYVEFEFVEGTSFLDEWSEFVRKNDRDKLLNGFDAFRSFLHDNFQTKPGTEVKQNDLVEFISGFGKVNDMVFFADHTNLDLSPWNILKDKNGVFNIFDYEWLVPFELPVDFVFYRSVLVFYSVKYRHWNLEAFLPFEEVCDYYHFDRELRHFFHQLENGFIQNVLGAIDKTGTVPQKQKRLWIDLDKHLPQDTKAEDCSQLFYDTGEGFNESQLVDVSCLTPSYNDDDFSFRFDIPSGVDLIHSCRWDPLRAETGMVLTLRKISCLVNDEVVEIPIEIDGVYNGYHLRDNMYVFDKHDPQIIFHGFPAHSKYIQIEGNWRKIKMDYLLREERLIMENTCFRHSVQDKTRQIEELNNSLAVFGNNIPEKLSLIQGKIDGLNEDLRTQSEKVAAIVEKSEKNDHAMSAIIEHVQDLSRRREFILYKKWLEPFIVLPRRIIKKFRRDKV